MSTRTRPVNRRTRPDVFDGAALIEAVNDRLAVFRPSPRPSRTVGRAPNIRAPNPTKPADEIERARLIDGMTNWQRNQWARAGYPRQLAQTRRFAALDRNARFHR